MDQDLIDQFAIRQVIDSWAIWRDSGDFERLRTCFHDDGGMTATWFSGSADDFVARARVSFAKGSMSNHVLGATSIDLKGHRAVAQTRMTIGSRETIDGVLYDITCVGRFYDLFEKRQGKWAIADRRLAYEKDRADPVFAGECVVFDKAVLARFPPGYRFLAYAQTKRGLDVARDLPGLRGPAVEALYARGKVWLAGESV
jgi:hypothetical protein